MGFPKRNRTSGAITVKRNHSPITTQTSDIRKIRLLIVSIGYDQVRTDTLFVHRITQIFNGLGHNIFRWNRMILITTAPANTMRQPATTSRQHVLRSNAFHHLIPIVFRHRPTASSTRRHTGTPVDIRLLTEPSTLNTSNTSSAMTGENSAFHQ